MAEKNHAPTPRRRQQMREKGEVAYSQDAGQLVALGLMVVYFGFDGARVIGLLAEIMSSGANAYLGGSFSDQVAALATRLGWLMFGALVPVLGCFFLAGITSDVLQVGPLWAPQLLKPTFSKINPLAQIKQLFSISSLVDFAKTVFKTVLMLGATWFAARESAGAVMRLSGAAPGAMLVVMAHLMKHMALIALACLVPLMLLDVLRQHLKLLKKARMSTEDIRREHKESEGAPESKQRRRQTHHEMMSEEVKQNVRDASVIVANPRHIAIGLYYRPDETLLPRVTVIQTDAVALAVRRLASEARVPVIVNVPLARALYAKARVGRYIPSSLIEAVAPVIAAVLHAQRAAANPEPSQ